MKSNKKSLLAKEKQENFPFCPFGWVLSVWHNILIFFCFRYKSGRYKPINGRPVIYFNKPIPSSSQISCNNCKNETQLDGNENNDCNEDYSSSENNDEDNDNSNSNNSNNCENKNNNNSKSNDKSKNSSKNSDISSSQRALPKILPRSSWAKKDERSFFRDYVETLRGKEMILEQSKTRRMVALYDKTFYCEQIKQQKVCLTFNPFKWSLSFGYIVIVTTTTTTNNFHIWTYNFPFHYLFFDMEVSCRPTKKQKSLGWLHGKKQSRV